MRRTASLFGAFCPFLLGGRQMRLRPKEQKSLENPRLSDAKLFCLSMANSARKRANISECAAASRSFFKREPNEVGLV